MRNWRFRKPENEIIVGGNSIYNCDALNFLKAINTEIADIIFLDPPFNLGKKYSISESKRDKLKEEEYIVFISSVLDQCVRILKPGGALYLYHLPKWAMYFGSKIEKELELRHWIAISMKNGFVRGNFLYPAHYALLYFSKGSPSFFVRPKIEPQKCKSCGEFAKDYGGYAEFVEDGINLSDIWDDISPVRHRNSKNRTENELPLKLLNRVIEISGVKEGLLIDPFVGSGTAIVAAKKLGMRFLACDREKEFCLIAAERYDKA
jgi:site-specific DNA-methyltransferase (adenine-specific)